MFEQSKFITPELIQSGDKIELAPQADVNKALSYLNSSIAELETSIAHRTALLKKSKHELKILKSVKAQLEK